MLWSNTFPSTSLIVFKSIYIEVSEADTHNATYPDIKTGKKRFFFLFFFQIVYLLKDFWSYKGNKTLSMTNTIRGT